MVETKHRTSDVIRSLKVTKSAIVGFKKIHEKNIEKCVKKQQKKVPVGSGVSLKNHYSDQSSYIGDCYS